MRFAIKIALILITLNISGCAYLTTYNHSVDLKKKSVAIDAKQRIITSQHNIICAEPSPDALAVLGASGALSASNASGVGGSASGGFAEAAGSIGLRTQSIQLLRDFNYRICEAYSNRAISQSEASALLRRGQSSMMGLIAIEQLTGPVVASQLALSSSINAGTGGPSGDIAAAQSALSAASDKHLNAQTEVDTATTEHQNNLKAVQDTNKKLSEALNVKTPDQRVIDSLSDSLKTARDAAQTSENTLKDKQRRARYAEAELASAKNRLADAERGKTAASGSASGQLGQIALANAQSTVALTREVRGIVADINKSYLHDTCFSLVSSLIKPETQADISSHAQKDPKYQARELDREAAVEAALATCSALFKETTKALMVQ